MQDPTGGSALRLCVHAFLLVLLSDTQERIARLRMGGSVPRSSFSPLEQNPACPGVAACMRQQKCAGTELHRLVVFYDSKDNQA